MIFKNTLYFLLFLAIFLGFFNFSPIKAQEIITVHFFWANGCPHCSKEKDFLNSLKEKYPQISIKDYEVTRNKNNLLLLQKVGQELNADVSGVPFTVIGDKYFAGFLSDETTGVEIEKEIKCAIDEGCKDVISQLDGQTATPTPSSTQAVAESVELPLLGKISLKNLSLPAITFIIALMDGFNPCAMWTLLFLISLLLAMKDRKKMWILGFSFIASSALVYFLFLAAWLNFFLFLGYIGFVRILIGAIALWAGYYNLKEYCKNKNVGCKVMGDKKRQLIFEKIKEIIYKKQFLVSLIGIIILAFAVNMVELICSAGLPAIYTKILSMSDLPSWQYYSYLVFYIIIFMIDDLFIFSAAMITLKVTGIQGKYSRYSHLVGGALMVIIGLMMIFKPDWLMFG